MIPREQRPGAVVGLIVLALAFALAALAGCGDDLDPGLEPPVPEMDVGVTLTPLERERVPDDRPAAWGIVGFVAGAAGVAAALEIAAIVGRRRRRLERLQRLSRYFRE